MSVRSVATQSSRVLPPLNGPATLTCNHIPYHLPPTPMPPARQPAVLQVVGYEILDHLGVGGMGVVYRARHRLLNRVVALKVLGWDCSADPDSHRRFQVEAEAVARLQHPNIIQVFDVGSFTEPHSGHPRPYLSLEYVDGGSLYRQTLSPQDPRQVATLLEKVARAVHAAHQVGVVHRDLKPANVLLTAEGEPKIADFGLAKQIDHRRDERGGFLTQDGTAVGTPEYMAPEQVDGLPATPAFDIYSLGVMLYELLTARQPFKGLTVTETMLMVKYQEPVPPSRLRPSLPKDLETICLKCMAKSPAARYSTAEQMADDLARWLAGQPIHARPVSRVERLGRWAKRNPSLATISGVALLLAVAGVSGVTWKWREAEVHATVAQAKAKEAEDRREGEQWELYRGCLAAVSADLRMNTLSSTRDTLARSPKPYRAWEWDYYHSQLDVSREVYPITATEINWPQVLPGGRVCLHTPARLWVWDSVARKALVRPSDPHFWSFTPDGKGYLAKADNRHMSLFPLDTEAPAVRVQADDDDDILASAFTPDGQRLLLIGRNSSRVYDTSTGRPVGASRPRGLRDGDWPGQCGISPDGTLAAVYHTGSGYTEVWDVETGRVRFSLTVKQELYALRFTPDGGRLYANEAYPSNKLRMWDSRTGRDEMVFDGHTNNITDLAFSPNGKVVATASLDQTVRLWEVASARVLYTFRGHTSRVNSVAFSPDGTRVVSAAEDRTIRQWDTSTGLEQGVFRGHAGFVASAAFMGNDTVVSVGRDFTVRYWDARPGAGNGIWAGHKEFVYSAAFHPDGEHVVSGSWDGTARVWDASGNELRRFDHPGERVCAVAVNPTGKWLASVCWGDHVFLWDYASGKRLHEWKVGHGYWKTGRLAFHPTADLLAACGGHSSVEVYDPSTRETVVLLQTKADAVRDVAFSPNGKWLAAAGDADKIVHVWEVGTWKKVAELKASKDANYALAFSPDSGTLACGSHDGNVYVWTTASWNLEATLPHGVRVHGVTFTPDGTRLACGCEDNTIRLWDMTHREQVTELRGHAGYVHQLAFSPDGRRLVSASGDHTLRAWDTTSPSVKWR